MALPGLRVGRAGMERSHDLGLRGGAGAVQLEVNALGRVIRELDREEGVQGEEVGLTLDAGLQQSVLRTLSARAPARWSWTAAEAGCWRWPPNSAIRSDTVQLGHFSGAMAAWTSDQADAADQQGGVRAVPRPGPPQDGGSLAGLKSKAIESRRPVPLSGYLDLGNAPYCWRGAATACSTCPGRDQEQLRRLLLRGGAAHRDRSDRRDGKSFGTGRGVGADLPGQRSETDADAGVAPQPRPRLEPGRHDRHRMARVLLKSRRCGSRSTYPALPAGVRCSRTDP